MQSSRKSNDLSLTSCIRLSPYKKWSSSPHHQDKFSSSLCAVCNMESLAQNRTVNSGHHRVTTRSSVSSLNSSPIKDNLLYEPYKMRPIKPSISIVHCKHLATKDNNELVNQYPPQSPHQLQYHRVKTDLKTNKNHDNSIVLSSPSRRNANYSNGTTPPVQLSENTLPLFPSSRKESTINFVTTKPTNDYSDFKSRKILEESSIDTLNYGQSTFRKINDTNREKHGYNVGILEATTHDKNPSNNPQYCQIVENLKVKNNIKCGNSSCNGSEPLKETHITGNNMPTYTTTEQRLRHEVALLRGKVRELSKNKQPSLALLNHGISNPSNKNLLKKNEKIQSKNVEKPRKLPVKRSPVCIKHVPKVVDLHNALEIEDDKPGTELREKVIIVENPTPTIIKQQKQRLKTSENKIAAINDIEVTTSPVSSSTPHVSSTPSKICTVPLVTPSVLSISLPPRSSRSTRSSLGGGSPQHVISKKDRPVTTPLLTELNDVLKENESLNGQQVQHVCNPISNAQSHTKNRKKMRDLNNSDSESELSDSECTDPDEVDDTEEKQINYETVLSELVTIRNDLYLSYTTNNELLRQSPSGGESGDTGKSLSVLRPSLFPNVPPYLRFYPHDHPGPKLPASIQRQLKWRLSNITPVIVRKTLINSGFRLIRADGIIDNNDWIGIWGKHIKSPLFKELKECQKINHFPGTFQLGRKDRLWRNTQKLQIKFGLKEFDYVPKTYILPQDLKQLRHVWEKGEGVIKWILKPPASARGSGIRVVNKWNQVPKKKPLVVQRYIDNPYLINGSKFDLRLYVLLTSFDPLRIYLYPDGLARFASVKYSSDSSSLDNRYMHLTNYSINKLSRDYTANEDAGACQGHKWTIQALWDYLSKNGVNTSELWATLQDLVIKTIISGESGITQLLRGNVGSRYNCYELFGVDVLLDEDLKPWLLEVNISPSLHSTSPLDLYVKGPLVQTLLNMAQYHIPSDTLTPQQRTNVIKNLGINKLQNNKLINNSTTVSSNKTSKQRPHTVNNPKSGGPTLRSNASLLNGTISPDGAAGGDHSIYDIPLSFDNRIYTIHLSSNERLKQNLMTSYQHRSDYLNDILINLTPDDVRHLITAEDELQAAGKFQKIFPTNNTYHYLQLMEPRYYDRLFDAWEHKYSSNKILGIGLLQACCARKYHWIVPPPPKIYKENTPQPSERTEETVENAAHHHHHPVILPINQAPIPSTDGATILGEPSPNQKPRLRFVRRRRYVYGGHNGRSFGITFRHYPSLRLTSRYYVRSNSRIAAARLRHRHQQTQSRGVLKKSNKS